MLLNGDDIDQINENLGEIIRIGVVSSTDPATCTARVTFEDREDMVSYNLPMLQRNTLKNKDYSLPDIGEMVVCIFLGNGMEQGFILGSFYNDPTPPAVNSTEIREVVFSDGTKIRHDREKSEFTLDCKGKIDILAAKDVSIKSDIKITLEAPEVAINAATLQLNVSGETIGTGGGSVDWQASKMAFKAGRIDLN